jgi:hypothetical protein
MVLFHLITHVTSEKSGSCAFYVPTQKGPTHNCVMFAEERVFATVENEEI